jgi:hypothetical protein
MDLTRFPFDNVTCSLTFESFKYALSHCFYAGGNIDICASFSYNTDEVQMDWTPLGVSKMREKMELADYELTSIENVRKTEV